MKVSKFCIPLVLVVLITSCKPKKEKVEKIEVPLSFRIVGGISPYKESMGSAFLKMYNNSSINAARKNHLQSAEVLVDPDSLVAKNGVPLYDNVVFFPVLSKDSLLNIVQYSYDKRGGTDSTATVDFNHYFTFLVTHPPSNKLYSDIVSEQHVRKDTLCISLVSIPYPVTTGSDTVESLWMTGVFKLPKKKYRVLSVKYLEKVSFFDLK
ncbi:hypothetical protein [Pedobacter caeni]|uniref:Lipoprotein n=1 Tax=Pedobacter caeni TaxID=288992 RepID=A0A1M5BYV5_9SPHI|nr:hypothetical protein [Pedobacter caeni]SHF47669.1 hypothetical protein SAMN04488522_1021417 [Pedobacter caeni]